MGNEWSLIKLKDIVDISTTKISVDDVLLINYISTENMLPDFGDIQLASSKPADGKISVYKKGDILFSNIRTYFKKLWLADRDGGCSNDVIVFRPKKEISAGYVYHLLMDQKFIDYASKTSKGTKMPRGDKGAIMEYSFSLAPKLIREAISNRLLTIKSKITLNRQINQTLEQMAQTLFKSWFVDFDPVIDNALDAGNEIPEPLQARAELRQKVRASQDFQPLPAEVRALFPAEFEESELGWMPKGWEVQALFDLAEFINGAAYKAFNPNTIKMGKPIIKIAELKSGITESTAYSDIDMPSKYLLQDSDILFSWSGNPDTSIDTFVWSLGEAWLNQHIFKVVPKNIKHRSYVLMTLKYLKPTFTAIARDKQTTGLGHVTVKDLKELLLPIPASVTIETTGNLFNSYLDQIFGLTKQIQNLISLRDALLPKLISGELALDDLPADVAEAAEAV